jgi:hypothetical protein
VDLPTSGVIVEQQEEIAGALTTVSRSESNGQTMTFGHPNSSAVRTNAEYSTHPQSPGV